MVSNSEIMSQRPFQTWEQKRIFVLMHIHSGSLNNIPMTVQNYVIITWHYDDMQYFCGIIAVRSLIASWKHLLTQKKRPTKDLFYWTKSYLTWKASPCPALYVLSEASFPSVKNICLFSKLLTSTYIMWWRANLAILYLLLWHEGHSSWFCQREKLVLLRKYPERECFLSLLFCRNEKRGIASSIVFKTCIDSHFSTIFIM